MDTDPNKIRGSLMAMSITIIAFTLGDGSLGDKGSFMGGSFTFKNVNVLYSIGISIFVYLSIRYHSFARKVLWDADSTR